MVLTLSFFALIFVIMMCVTLQPSLADEVDARYGEYESIGNTWIELTHSAANPPPWQLDWHIDHPDERHPGFSANKQHEEIDIIKNFYQKYDITIIDAIRSSKNAQMCEATSCLFGTYHLLVPNEDVEKTSHANFGFVIFADSGINESYVGGDGTPIAHWEAEKIFLSSDGKFELNLVLSYDSPDPTTASYYSRESSREVFVDMDKLDFIDSMIVLVYPHGRGSHDRIPINADSISSKKANIQYSSNLDFPHNSLYGDRVEFGLGWIRIFEDENDQRYYQWMRSDSQNLLRMNEVQKANGTFSVPSPFPEFAHKSDDPSLRGFDYVQWIKENMKSCPPDSVSVNLPYKKADAKTVQNSCVYPSYIKMTLNSSMISKEQIITVTIPRIVFDARNELCDDDTFIVFVNDVEVKFNESKSMKFRTLEIPIKSDSRQVEIIGTAPYLLDTYWKNCISDIASEFSPNEQFQYFHNADKIICKSDLELALKASNGKPACLKPESKVNLVKYGWTS